MNQYQQYMGKFMNEFRELLERSWICKDTDKELYYRVRHAIPDFQRFVTEQLGWKIIHTENLLKLEKVPAHAENFMGIKEFKDIRDYCIFCVLLMYLEDMEEGAQFLLSELITFIETVLKDKINIDWTSFSHRKSLVRVLQFAEEQNMLRVFEGNSEGFSQEQGQEVLYLNTGYSRFFAVKYPFDISAYTDISDFETGPKEIDEERGKAKINRVYRRLVCCPAMYWDQTNDPDALYLKNQRQWISRYMEQQMGGRLDIHRNAAFWMLSEDDCYGRVHPRDAALPEIILLLSGRIRQKAGRGKWKIDDSGCIRVSESAMWKVILECRDRWKAAWSKEYQEMEEEKLIRTLLEYMEEWMLILRDPDKEEIIILPGMGKTSGYYPDDYQPV